MVSSPSTTYVILKVIFIFIGFSINTEVTIFLFVSILCNFMKEVGLLEKIRRLNCLWHWDSGPGGHDLLLSRDRPDLGPLCQTYLALPVHRKLLNGQRVLFLLSQVLFSHYNYIVPYLMEQTVILNATKRYYKKGSNFIFTNHHSTYYGRL